MFFNRTLEDKKIFGLEGVILTPRTLRFVLVPTYFLTLLLLLIFGFFFPLLLFWLLLPLLLFLLLYTFVRYYFYVFKLLLFEIGPNTGERVLVPVLVTPSGVASCPIVLLSLFDEL